jgi:hypothetical protein
MLSAGGCVPGNGDGVAAGVPGRPAAAGNDGAGAAAGDDADRAELHLDPGQQIAIATTGRRFMISLSTGGHRRLAATRGCRCGRGTAAGARVAGAAIPQPVYFPRHPQQAACAAGKSRQTMACLGKGYGEGEASFCMVLQAISRPGA